MSFFYIATGAAAGAYLRHVLQVGLSFIFPHFPMGTFIANLFGAITIGAITPFLSNWPPQTKLIFVTGFLGSLTTLSSFALEVVQLAGARQLLYAFLHWLGGAGLCVLACYGSYRLVGRLL